MSDAGDGSRPRWRLSTAQAGASAAGLAIAGLGVLLGRADVAVLGMPLLVLAAWGWARRPLDAAGAPARDGSEPVSPTVDLTVDEETDPATGLRRLRYRLRLPTPEGVEAVQLRVTPLGGTPRLLVLPASPQRAVELNGTTPVPHSGPQRVVAVEHREVAAAGALVWDGTESASADRVLLPAVAPLEDLPLPWRLTGLVGSHDSSRPGDGGEFHDIAGFRPGDRLRRIDWKATARLGRQPGDLFVRRTLALADATVVIAVDSTDDIDGLVAGWGRPLSPGGGTSSLDVARTAAASLAAGYLRMGDRVAFTDLNVPGRVVRAGAGTRHLDRLIAAIAATAPTGSSAESRRSPQVPPGAEVVLLSTFLDGGAATTGAILAAAGHRVVAIDTLPPPRPDGLDREQRLALRIVVMQRDDRLDALRAAGVDVLRWDEDTTTALQSAARPHRGGGRR